MVRPEGQNNINNNNNSNINYNPVLNILDASYQT